MSEFDIYMLEYESTLVERASTIEEIAQRELRKLRDHGVFARYTEIHLITHSMGGLVAKRMLVDLNRPTEMDSLRRVRTAVFLSTPSQGAKSAELASWLSMNPQLEGMKPADLNTFIQSLENQWQTLLRDRDAVRAVVPRSFCAYETRPTHGLMIVDRIYSATRCDETPYAVDADHMDIAKPRSTDSDVYVWVKARIREMTSRPGADMPKADPRVFSVAVAHLENDAGQDYERLIVAALTGLEGVEILRFDRTISLEGPRPQESVRSGHEQARRLLELSGAQLLIWGRVLRRDGKGTVQVYWTASGLQFHKPATLYDPLGVELPETFWTDLAAMLTLLVSGQHLEFSQRFEGFSSDQAEFFIERVQRLISDRQSQQVWPADQMRKVKLVLADGYASMAYQTRRVDAWGAAVSLYREIVNEMRRDADVVERAIVQRRMAHALLQLGESVIDARYMEEALTVFRAARQAFRDDQSEDQAATDALIARALTKLGKTERNTARLQESAALLRSVLYRVDTKQSLVRWFALSMLSETLMALGFLTQSVASIEEAAGLANEVATLSRQEYPLVWALMRFELGDVLHAFGEEYQARATVERSIEALRDAATVLTEERAPQTWARVQRSLGMALLTFAVVAEDDSQYDAAAIAFRQAVKAMRREHIFAKEAQLASAEIGLGRAMVGSGAARGEFDEACEGLRLSAGVWRRLGSILFMTREGIRLHRYLAGAVLLMRKVFGDRRVEDCTVGGE